MLVELLPTTVEWPLFSAPRLTGHIYNDYVDVLGFFPFPCLLVIVPVFIQCPGQNSIFLTWPHICPVTITRQQMDSLIP